ncbi:MAG TPA: class I SAM-dependent methyltransferase [Candidatus Eremiobacteraeota bacterium]|nr:MAG: Demethylrebeccamycin-D-glucose O-methyltransferase [bacterium ADurb.Bin363]HPZ06658.1 class I SAM-dependent methyltransferase [Candidatus Eremiobacteraeota bacterium]
MNPLSNEETYINQQNNPIEDWNGIYKKVRGNPPWESGQEEEILVSLVASFQTKKVVILDIGCGQGTDLIYLTEKGFKTIGLDISSYAIKKAMVRGEEKNLKLNLFQGDVLNLPFSNYSFDFINDRGCFHHIKKEERINYCQEIVRVLKNRGKLLLRVFSENYYKSGGSGQLLSKKDIKKVFQNFFELGEITDYRGKGNKWSVEMSWCFMRKRI